MLDRPPRIMLHFTFNCIAARRSVWALQTACNPISRNSKPVSLSLTPKMRAEVKAWIALTLGLVPMLGFLLYFAGPRVFHRFLVIVPLGAPLALLALIFGLTAWREMRARPGKGIAIGATVLALAFPVLFAWSFAQ